MHLFTVELHGFVASGKSSRRHIVTVSAPCPVQCTLHSDIHHAQSPTHPVALLLVTSTGGPLVSTFDSVDGCMMTTQRRRRRRRRRRTTTTSCSFVRSFVRLFAHCFGCSVARMSDSRHHCDVTDGVGNSVRGRQSCVAWEKTAWAELLCCMGRTDGGCEGRTGGGIFLWDSAWSRIA